MTFKQYFYLHQQFMFLCANCLSICLLLFFYVCVCVCVGGGGGGGGVQITPEPMNRSLFKKLWVGPDWRKKLLKERSGSYYGYKKIMNFQRSHFNVFLLTLAFYLIFLWRLIYMFILFYCLPYNTLYHLRDCMVTWSRVFCSLRVHLVIFVSISRHKMRRNIST